MPLSDLLRQKAKLTPKRGFNLVGLDTFDVEEGLYLIAHFETRAQAEQAQKKRTAAHPHEQLYIYGSGK